MNSFKRILALSLAVLTLSSFTACQLFKSDEKEKTDESTTLSFEDLLTATGSDTPITDYDGNTIVEDANSEIEDFNKKEEVLSQQGVETTKKASGTTKKGETTKKNTTTSSNKDTTLPNASNFNKLNQEIFSKGIFTIEGTMSANVDGQTMTLPFKLARDGKNQYVHASYTYSGVTIEMLINNSKTYLLIPALKSYQEMDESILGDSDYSGLTDVKTYGTTKRVQIGEDIYICEEIKGSDGYSTYFYFDENTGDLARIKFEDEEGESHLKVKSIKPSVNKSDFSVPKGYKKLKVEDLPVS